MDLRFSVIDPRRVDAAVNVAVRAAPGAVLAAVEPALRAAVGETGRAADGLGCGGAPVAGTAPLGVPPLVDGAALTLGGGSPPPAAALLEAHVVAGPDAGAVVPLPPGTWTIGRAAQNALRIGDPDVSRLHASLRVEPSEVFVADAGSTNGTWVDGAPVGPDAVRLAPGSRLRVGGSTVVVRAPVQRPAAMHPDGAGGLRLNRPPRIRAPEPVAAVTYPEPLGEARPLRLPWPAVLLPLVVSAVLALWWRQPSFLLLAVMSPLLLVGQYAADRHRGRRDRRDAAARHARRCEEADERLAAALAADARRREAAHPDLASLATIAGTPTERLWERRSTDADAMHLRLGRGSVPAAVILHRPRGPGGTRAEPGDSGAPAAAPPRHPDVPVAVDLAAVAVAGVSGSREAVLGLARSLVGQVAVLRSPREVRLTVLVAADRCESDWTWAAWLPHHAPELPAVCGDLAERPASAAPDPAVRHVVVLDGAQALRRRPDVARLLRDGARYGVALVCLEDDAARLPAECRATVTVPDDGRGGVLDRDGEAPLRDIALDLAGRRWAERLGRALAPLREATPEPGDLLPREVRLLDVWRDCYGVDATSPGDVAQLWRERRFPPGAAVLGLDGAGPHVVRLPADGPHVLVAGTTGAGKSELLQTLVTSLAVAHPPDTLAFVLVDYKGGTAFAECAGLPHVTGLVTDLDAHESRRALASLAAELRRRERLFREAGVAELDSYEALRDTAPAGFGPPPVPRLIVVVDEFRILAEELPDLLSGLVRTATVGRALGVHLVLATQRPGGVVSADIRANVNLRIALRVQDRADSLDVIDDAAAAELPHDAPGRAFLRAGGGAPAAVQIARVSGTAPATTTTVTTLDAMLRPVAAAATRVASHQERSSGGGRHGGQVSDLVRVADAIRNAATLLRLPRPDPPWLPPLPAVVPLADVAGMGSRPGRAPDEQGPSLLLGLADEPDRQRQGPVRWHLAGRQLAVAGGPRSGRTTALRVLATAAGTHPATPVHVYAVDPAGGLAGLELLPHVGAVVPAADVERADRLLTLLAAGTGSSSETKPDRIPCLLLVDGLEAVTETWAGFAHGRLVDDLLRIMRDGARSGVHVAVSGGRSLLTGPAAALLTDRLVLPFPDRNDAALAGLPVAALPLVPTPGRGLWLSAGNGPVDVQVALPPEEPPGGPDPADAGPHRLRPRDRSARPHLASVSRPAGNRPRRVPALPVRIGTTELSRQPRPAPVPGAVSVPIGVRAPSRDDAGEPAVAALLLMPGAVVPIVGPPRSGCSSALATIGRGVLDAGHGVLAIAAPPSPLARIAGPSPPDAVTVIDPFRPAVARHLADALSQRPADVVIADDAALLPPPLTEPLTELLTAAARDGPVVVGARAEEVLRSFHGVLAMARGARSGLLLGEVASGDGEVFGLRLGPAPRGPAGRGWLVTGGRACAVQVAEPPPSGRDEGSCAVPGRSITRQEALSKEGA